MDTFYKEGDTIKANVTAQGLEKGRCYEVTSLDKDDKGMFGTLVTYWVREVGSTSRPFAIGNAHLITERA